MREGERGLYLKSTGLWGTRGPSCPHEPTGFSLHNPTGVCAVAWLQACKLPGVFMPAWTPEEGCPRLT